MPQSMAVKERILLIAWFSDSLVDFRSSMESVGANDALGRQMYYLSIMLSEVEESDYVLPNPDVEHLAWVFHETVSAMLNLILCNPDEGVMKAYSYYQKMRDVLLYGEA